MTGEGEDIKLNKFSPFSNILCITQERGFYSLSRCRGEKRERVLSCLIAVSKLSTIVDKPVINYQ